MECVGDEFEIVLTDSAILPSSKKMPLRSKFCHQHLQMITFVTNITEALCSLRKVCESLKLGFKKEGFKYSRLIKAYQSNVVEINYSSLCFSN